MTVVLCACDLEGALILAETATSGDPSFTGLILETVDILVVGEEPGGHAAAVQAGAARSLTPANSVMIRPTTAKSCDYSTETID